MVDKQKQFELITNGNPFNSELGNHTWIKDVSDIKTYEEVWQEEGGIYGITPDFSKKDAIDALNSGKIVVYSSYPIKNGIFVSPSKMEAMNYAGGNKVYSKVVNLEDVAWIDPTQGQYANTNVVENKTYMKKIIRLTESELHKIVENSVKRILKEGNELYNEWYQEEDYNGNYGQPGMIRSYNIGAYYVSNAEQDAKESGFNSLEEYLKYWVNEILPDCPWEWTKVGNGYGYNGDTLVKMDGIIVKDIYGQIMVDEYPIADARRDQDFSDRLQKGEYWIK